MSLKAPRIVAVAALVALVLGGAGACSSGGDDTKSQFGAVDPVPASAAASPSASSTPAAPSASPSPSASAVEEEDIATAKVGDWFVNRGTNSEPDMRKVACAPGS
jgi:hypothetical protein